MGVDPGGLGGYIPPQYFRWGGGGGLYYHPPPPNISRLNVILYPTKYLKYQQK